MFVRWINQNQGRFVAYEQNGGYGKTLETNLTLVSNNQGWTISEYGRGPWVFQRKK
jgi:cytochrome bd-type quinol oxidase subunit 1